MPTFNYSFTVEAPRSAVAAFHQDARVLKMLTPPPIFVELHEVEPLGEGSIADFTLWFGPFPVRWKAVHSDVSESGFTDTQVAGPLKYWRHRHQFVAVSNDSTEIRERIDYQYKTGLKGLINRIFYSKVSLTLLFAARSFITRRNIRRIIKKS